MFNCRKLKLAKRNLKSRNVKIGMNKKPVNNNFVYH